MKETGKKHFHYPSTLQIIAGLLLAVFCLNNVTLYTSNRHLQNEVETLRTEMNERFGGSTEDVMNITDTINILQQATMLNVENQDDFLAFLTKNKESKELGGSGYLSYGEHAEPTRIPWWVRKNAIELNAYTVRPFDVYDNIGGGTTKYYGDPLQPNDNGYDFIHADGYSITIDMDKLTLNPYGIFEGNIYVIYDNDPEQQTSHSIQIFIYDEKANTSYKLDIPFLLFTDNAGIKFKYEWPFRHGDKVIALDFVVDWEDEMSDTYAMRTIGENMIGNIMAYTKSAYNELPA